MSRRLIVVASITFMLAAGMILPVSSPAQGQSLTLPADLFILNARGQVMHIAVGDTFAAQVTPADQSVVDFGVAPDGQWIAYRTAANENSTSSAFLAVMSIDGLSGQLLEFEEAGQPPVTGRGQTIAWSPDATVIAYTTAGGLRVYMAGMGPFGEPVYLNLEGGPFINLEWSPGGGYLAAEAESNVWWIYRRDGASVTYAGQVPNSAGLTWVQEGVMAVAPPSGGLITLNLSDGAQTALLGAEILVSQPTLITGNRLIVLVHESAGSRFAARRFGIVSTLGGDYQQFDASLELTTVMRWLPDGVALMTSIDGALTIIEPRTNTQREIVSGVKSYAWGPVTPTEITGMILPETLYFLSRDTAGIAQVWKLPADGNPAQQITSEIRNVLDFNISPDGSQIAYTSGGRLIAMNIDGTGGRELSPTVERPGAGAQPAWSPNGQLIAFVRDGIWLVPATGGARTELITDSFDAETPPADVRVYLQPRWSPDGTLLLVDVGYYEGRGLALLPITGGEAETLPVAVTQGDWLPNGQVLAWDYGYAYIQPGLYTVDPGNLEVATTILDEMWHVFDAVPLANEAAMILRSPSGDTLGPSAAQPFLVPILPDALPIPQGKGGLIETPTLSANGNFAAGLRATNYGDFGMAGRLILINLTTGERFAIETPGEVWGLHWGGM